MAEPLYRGSIRGDYSPATSNHRLKAVVVGRSARLVRASVYVAWERQATAQLREQNYERASLAHRRASGNPCLLVERTVILSPVRVEIDVRHPITHRKGAAVGLARIDVDALIKSTLDALVAAGVLLDDSLVVELVARKHVAPKSEQRIDVAVWTVEGER